MQFLSSSQHYIWKKVKIWSLDLGRQIKPILFTTETNLQASICHKNIKMTILSVLGFPGVISFDSISINCYWKWWILMYLSVWEMWWASKQDIPVFTHQMETKHLKSDFYKQRQYLAGTWHLSNSLILLKRLTASHVQGL